MLKVLVACEYSGIVRTAFSELGHDATSCDLVPSELPGKHILGDVRELDLSAYDLLIAHPPCTHLAISGAKHFHRKQAEQAEALEFVRYLLDAPTEHIALENPVSVISTRIRKPTQIIQPWQYGHEASKKTCLWLKGLPQLIPTAIVGKGERHVTKGGKSLPSWYNLPPSPDRGKQRSRTFTGIAKAMAEQWSKYLEQE